MKQMKHVYLLLNKSAQLLLSLANSNRQTNKVIRWEKGMVAYTVNERHVYDSYSLPPQSG